MSRIFLIRNEAIAIASICILSGFFALTIGASWFNNIPSLLRDVSWLGIVVIGQALVIMSGEFDLSVGSVYAFVSMVFVLLLNEAIPPGLSLLLSLGLAAAIGYLTGLLTWRLKLPSLLVTLGFLFFYRGMVEWVTDGFPVTIDDEIRSSVFITLLGGKTLGLHNSIMICALLVAVFTVMLSKFRFGNHLYAVGGDTDVALATGVPAGAIKTWVFVICSGLAGFAGIITAASLSSVSTTTATAMELESIAAVVIGGCLLLGGSGTVWGALLGVVTLLLLKHGLIILGVNIFAYQVCLGVVLVGLVALKGVVSELELYR
ncbi:MAG: ABC transporter permease [Rhodobacteraceae bacterium]|nr:ABC transporter permease [Paracoccaceae bacterium]